MARVTVEDCVERIPNRFELVLLAAERSRKISGGSEITVEKDNDKNPVIALREIADETIDFDDVRDSLVKGLQKVAEIDEPEEDDPTEYMSAALAGGEDTSDVETASDDESDDREESDEEQPAD